jgi:hypothetical protein
MAAEGWPTVARRLASRRGPGAAQSHTGGAWDLRCRIALNQTRTVSRPGRLAAGRASALRAAGGAAVTGINWHVSQPQPRRNRPVLRASKVTCAGRIQLAAEEIPTPRNAAMRLYAWAWAISHGPNGLSRRAIRPKRGEPGALTMSGGPPTLRRSRLTVRLPRIDGRPPKPCVASLRFLEPRHHDPSG